LTVNYLQLQPKFYLLIIYASSCFFSAPDPLRSPLDTPFGRHKEDEAGGLPDEVFAVIDAFLPDATTACRCFVVCKAFYQAIQRNDGLWKNLADKVWKIARYGGYCKQ
jgi:hypothetical protein